MDAWMDETNKKVLLGPCPALKGHCNMFVIATIQSTLIYSLQFNTLDHKFLGIQTKLPRQTDYNASLGCWQPMCRCVCLFLLVGRTCCPCIFYYRSDCRSRGISSTFLPPVPKNNERWVPLPPTRTNAWVYLTAGSLDRRNTQCI
jgi:hypothetical protein